MRLSLVFIFITSFLYAQESITEFQKQKDEIIKLKKELTEFYDLKEKEYQDRKKELMTIQTNIEKAKKDIETIKNDNSKLLKSITQAVQGKTSSIFNGMKAKNAAEILNQMIADGKIEDVLDIIITLNEKNVTGILKFMSVENSAQLTLMIKNYSKKAKSEEK